MLWSSSSSLASEQRSITAGRSRCCFPARLIHPPPDYAQPAAPRAAPETRRTRKAESQLSLLMPSLKGWVPTAQRQEGRAFEEAASSQLPASAASGCPLVSWLGWGAAGACCLHQGCLHPMLAVNSLKTVREVLSNLPALTQASDGVGDPLGSWRSCQCWWQWGWGAAPGEDSK